MVKGQRSRLGIRELISAIQGPVHSNSKTVSSFFFFLFFFLPCTVVVNCPFLRQPLCLVYYF